MLKTPVALFIFNRPDTTEKVFETIRQAKPLELFVIADGGRNKEEWEKCKKAREITENIDWDCVVKKNYSDINLGCKIRVSSGINWFFENVDEGIILEDDTLPNQSFFRFCTELLEHYRDNEKIMMISGDNFQNGIKRGDGSYYFSRYAHIWGWAAWKRTWDKYDVELKNVSESDITDIIEESKERDYWIDLLIKIKNDEIDTWDYQWTYSILKNNGLSIVPNTNMVSNIGFGEYATHTKNTASHRANLPTYEMEEIMHPTKIERDAEADKYTATQFEMEKTDLISKTKKYLGI